jgi:hypothetical protein
VQPPLESVTTVLLPSDAELVEKLPLPEWWTVPPGPVVVPLTLPLPAVIDVDMPELLPGGLSPFLRWTTLQFLLSVVDELELPEPALAVELLELLVCANAVDATTVIARKATSAFTSDLLSDDWG